MIQTLNQHIKLFSDFQDAHKQLNSFGFGDPWEWYNKLKDAPAGTLQYPAMFVSVNRSTIQENLHTREYTVFFCDRQQKDESDENEVLSDMELICTQFFAYLFTQEIGAQVVDTSSGPMTPFTERGDDYLAGYELTFTIKQDFEYESCAVPITISDIPTPPPPSGGCSSITIRDSGSFTQSISCAESPYTIPDSTINVYVNGVLNQTITASALTDKTININA